MRIRPATAVVALSLTSPLWPLAPSQPSASSALSPSRLVDKCALRAQHKQRRNHSAGGDSSIWERLGGGSSNGTRTPFLSGLPVRQVRYDHVHRRGALFCRTGNWLELAGEPDERVRVRGTRREQSRFTLLEFLAVAFGLVSIRSVANQHYLCMDSAGHMYAAPAHKWSAECVFMEEMLHNYYNLYSSCAYGSPHRPWFVALRRTGRERRGRHTRRRQKSSHFVIVESRGSQKSSILDSFGHANTRVDSPLVWKYFYDLHHSSSHQRHAVRGKKLRWELPKEVVLLEGQRKRKRGTG